MRKRKKLDSGKSKRLFTGTAQNIHPRNSSMGNPMRGGIRL